MVATILIHNYFGQNNLIIIISYKTGNNAEITELKNKLDLIDGTLNGTLNFTNAIFTDDLTSNTSNTPIKMVQLLRLTESLQTQISSQSSSIKFCTLDSIMYYSIKSNIEPITNRRPFQIFVNGGVPFWNYSIVLNNILNSNPIDDITMFKNQIGLS